MIKRLLAVCLLMLVFLGLKAQPYGNEWINYSQQYYKIKIAQNGIYRIDSATLAASGIPVGFINAHNFQVFNKGIQQYIYIEGESDGVLNGADFIEFYAEPNDGKLDSLLYKNTFFLPNPYYSLINDTAVYYLTWNTSLSNRRMSPDTSTAFSTYPILDDYFFKEEIQSFHSEYFNGETDAVGGTDPRYIRSEGWFDASVINLGGVKSYNVITPNVYTGVGAPDALIKTVAIGASRDALIVGADHHLKITFNGGPFKDTTFLGYELCRFITSTAPSSLVNSAITPNTFQYSSIADIGFTSNRTTVSYITINYPHTFDLEGKNKFLLALPDNTSQPKSHLYISNFGASGTVRLYDLSNAKRITVVSTGSNYEALVQNSGNIKKCFITSDGSITNIVSLQAVTPSAQFTDFSLPVDSAYVIISHKLIMSGANNYKTYRSGVSGGSHNVILADIDELYDQFAYGIVKSPFSVRGFADYLLDHNPSAPPKNLFLLGKSIHVKECRQDPLYYANDLVPSFGNPSSDNMLTAGLNGTVLAPAIPTGRLAAKNLTDVDLYLNKIMQYESNAPDEWMKEVLHFGGGATDGEQSTFKTYLNNYEDTIENVFYGGHVTEFFKTSSAPIEINTSDQLQTLINNGVSLMTFFGHASGTGFDESIDNVNSYNPLPGHYPFVLANSCYAGDFHSAEPNSSSETFILIANKGMIGYLGSVGLGVPYALNIYTDEFYSRLSHINYGKSIGEVIQKTVNVVESAMGNDSLQRTTCYEMSLHGDPALKINMHDKPDYKITGSDLYVDLTTSSDSCTVYAIRTNLGKATNDSIFTELIRIKPNGDTVSYLIHNKSPRFKDTVSFKIPIDLANGIGLNKVIVTLDRFNNVNELNEGNNTTGNVDVFINGGDIVPVFPYQFAIVPHKDTLTLKASTANPFATARNYKFEIDTTDTFNSPHYLSTIIDAPGGVVKWKLPAGYVFSDSTVYYWRVSPDSTGPSNGFKWRESSFQYIKNRHGWEQAHFFQFKNDGYQYVKFNRPARKFDFVNDVKSIYCKDGIYPYIPYYDIIYKINGDTKYLFSWLFPAHGLTFAVINPISGEQLQNYVLGGGFGTYGSITSSAEGVHENAFEFFDDTSLVNQNKIASFIDAIPNGYYVLAYSEQYQQLRHDPIVNTAMATIGASDLSLLHDSVPYILWGKKGFPGSGIETIGARFDSTIQFTTTLNTNWNDGYIASPVIGPALEWKSLHWRQNTIDPPPSHDSIGIRVIGIKADGHEDIRVNFPADSIDVIDLANYVDAAVYPNIRMMAYMKDTSNHTPPQMKRWQVIYDPVPEAAVNPPLGYAINNNTLQEGDNLNIRLPIQNISDTSFTDSLLVTYWIQDANRVNHPLPSKLKKKPFIPNEVILDTINVNTMGYAGVNSLWVEVNPVNKPKSQLEKYHFNNVATIPFTISSDHINPLLDVTFDGVHILNNDIISAKPNILIKLKDENQFLALNDTNDFKVFIKAPSSGVALRVYFGSLMSFIPAVLPNNSCKINYTPALTQDGTYQLIVQAKDKSNNQSGAIDYKINFEVINKATITEVMNYPNPFSTATHFVFTLTGSEVPTYFKIQIMTITGKVVREITNNELGLVHIGRNITDYAWDGRDEFGDRLANGVYLYRVVTSIRGESIENRETAADQYFKKGFGKMFLMR